MPLASTRASSPGSSRAPSGPAFTRTAAFPFALGADLTTRLYANTGPAIRDRHAAPMLELLLAAAHPRFARYTEVGVLRPSRGWIDALLHDPRERLAIASELQSELRRLEQLVRWQAAKAESLPSWEGWSQLGDEPRISRLLVVRRTRATRQVAAEFARQLRVAYPAHPDDALAALTGTAPWPGPALVWMTRGRARAPGRPRVDERWYPSRPRSRSRAAVAMTHPRTLVEKIWDQHVVSQDDGAPAVLAIDLHLVHEVTSPQAFTGLRTRGVKVRRPDKTVATADHGTPTTPRGLPMVDMQAAAQIRQLETNCADFGIPIHAFGSDTQGIVHVIGPELGLTQPGMTIVCGDSHTATHGAFGALAFGIGTSEVEMVLATQTLLQRKPKTYEVRVDGRLNPGVSAKDIILALIARIGIGGGTGHVFEFRGEAIRALNMEQRMTICNMSIEGGARAGLIAPDETTFEYIRGRRHAPQGADWDGAVAHWRTLPTDEGAVFDKSIVIDATALEPMVTYGNNPGMGIPVSGRIPRPEDAADPGARRGLERALEYMDLEAGAPIAGQPVDVVFIGTCTNSRISDLRLAASVLKDRHAADGVRLMIVPGSQQVKAQAEREGLHEIFRAAGAEWREAGCSMCIAMNGDQLSPGQYAVSTSNRNFEGRQGKGGRTFLACPLTAAASAPSPASSPIRARCPASRTSSPSAEGTDHGRGLPLLHLRDRAR